MENEGVQLSALQDRYAELLKIVESFEILERSKEWIFLKEKIFDKSVESIERQILLEAQNAEVHLPKIYMLQGELKWAKRYVDTNRYIEGLKKELTQIKKQINGK